MFKKPLSRDKCSCPLLPSGRHTPVDVFFLLRLGLLLASPLLIILKRTPSLREPLPPPQHHLSPRDPDNRQLGAQPDQDLPWQ
jgi:hypothetical protein